MISPHHNPALAEALRFPHVSLTGGGLEMIVLLPDAQAGFYAGPRFDWSGLIARVAWGGHTFFGPWKAARDPAGNDDVVGPAEEFGMQDPPGYAEARPSGTFLKVGVGLLIKEADEEYRFFHPYRIETPGAWAVRHGDDWAEFEQTLHDGKGRGYRYVKRIELEGDRPGFTIRHRLENVGERAWTVNHYCHNFVVIDDVPVGPDYTLTLPFPPRPVQDIGEFVQTAGTEMRFVKPLDGARPVYAEFLDVPQTPASNGAVITCGSVGLRIEGNQAPVDYHLFAVNTALCPEPFLSLSPAPGRAEEWRNSYTLFLTDGGDSH